MIGYVATHGDESGRQEEHLRSRCGLHAYRDARRHAQRARGARAVPVATLQEFVAYAKANPRKVDYGTSGVGTLNHLVMEQFKHASGVPSMSVPYRSIGQAFTDLMGGQIQVIFPGLAAAMPHIRSGAFKPLAVTGDKRNPLLPDVPTFKEAGYPGFDALTWYGIVGPAKHAGAIIAS